MLRVALLQFLLLTCWPSSHARGVYKLVPLEYANQDVNLLVQDGSLQSGPAPYSFTYIAEGADGSSSRQETGSASGSVSGSYSLKIKDGRSRQVDYTADAGGFKAQVNTNEPGTKSDNPAEVSFQSLAPQLAPAGIALIPAGGHAISYQSGIAAVDGVPSPYSFGYVAEGDGISSHQETGDGSGNVKGSYSLKIKDGRSRQVDYSADAAGFKAKINTNELGTKTGSSADAHYISSSPQEVAAVPSLYASAPIGGSGTIQVSQLLNAGGDAPSPYAFSYSAGGLDGGSSHQESSDGAGNVRGSYSLKVKDGRSRKVDYTADAAGFKASVNTNEPGTKSDSTADATFHSSAPQLAPAITGIAPAFSGLAPAIPGPVHPALGTGSAVVTYQAGVGTDEGAPIPYSFGYTAEGVDGSSSHQESSDGAGNVKGSYSLKIKDGRQRQVEYTADAGGFKANVNTNEPGTKSDSPAEASFHSSAPEIPAIGAPVIPGPAFQALPSGGAAISFHAGVPGSEGAPSPYSFGYTAQGIDGASSHQESSDGSGRVTGTYSLNIKDGRRRKVDYTADAGGFKANVDTSEPGTKSDSPAQASFHSTAPQITSEVGAPASPYFIPAAGVGASVVSYQGVLGGAEGAPSPYSFGYTAAGPDGSSSRHESSDGSGNVRGSYSLKIKDGRSRQVDYTADAAGFKANVNTNEPGTTGGVADGAVYDAFSPQHYAAASGIPSAVTFQITPGASEDAPSPYSFGYVAEGKDGSSSHQETGDGSGRVSGSYSLKIKDGRSRKVDYTADGAGFKANVNTNEPGTKSDSPAEVSFHSSAPQLAPIAAASQVPVIPFTHAGGAVISYQGGIAAGEGAPFPYSFGYSAQGKEGGSSHQETGDGSGRVSGSYSLSVNDGRRRKVDYTADAAGFKASVNTNEPGTKSENPAEVSFHSSASLIAGDLPLSQPHLQSVVHGPRQLTEQEKRWVKSL